MTDLIKRAKAALEAHRLGCESLQDMAEEVTLAFIAETEHRQRIEAAAVKLSRAACALSLAAQTTGGTAGRDQGLMDAIDMHAKAEAAFHAALTTPSDTPRRDG